MRGLSVALGALIISACGAKTGLLIPEAGVDGGVDAAVDAPIDAPMDVPVDVPVDVGIDAPICVPRTFELTSRGSQVVITVDRSSSMRYDLVGNEPPIGPDRWTLLRDALRGALTAEVDQRVEVGAKFFPRPLRPDEAATIEEVCSSAPGLDLRPATRNVGRLLRIFDTTEPGGGTPTATALWDVRDFFRTDLVELPRFVLLATDGGPNCSAEPSPPPPACLCTGPDASFCDPRSSPIAGYNCIDQRRTLDVISELYDDLGVPVFVVGIDDPSRPDLSAVLDRMAVAGGRPLPVGSERRYYSVRRVDDLRAALGEITDAIARCVYTIRPAPTADAEVEIRVDGVPVPRDPTQTEGWDYLVPNRSQIGLFGAACEATSGGAVDGIIDCPDL